jgi:flagellar assembly factor FliW
MSHRGTVTPPDASGGTSSPRVLQSRRFGPLAAPPDRLFHFPAGLLGFEEYTEYLLHDPEALYPIRFLVASADPELAFPVLAAVLCTPDYAPPLPPEVWSLLGAQTEDLLEVLAVLTLDPETATLHANLRGPVVINPATRRGCQIVLQDSPYSLRHLLSVG